MQLSQVPTSVCKHHAARKTSQISMKLSNLDHSKFWRNLLDDLQCIPSETENMTIDNINSMVANLTEIIRDNYLKQGKRTNVNATKHKPWWDKKILTPLVKGINKECKWALIDKTTGAKKCPHAWQFFLKQKSRD
ncbi:hypothetical protein O181_084189 [Austropuccinia psidii MF-1]|uniref:Uncharacterized protein n=1 Tax=Austropuccinia psidii MF-1 TaxID=1389203 RepID=A0A9Q3FSZ9_9BASI|nr:hypothetical protein [Austropuccinia psidii MF-1]